MPDPTIVCVLGMHRSGTSVAARILNLLGASLGPDHGLVCVADDNPKGFWEHQPIVALNDEILVRLGGNCIRLPAFPAGWENAPELDDLREWARAILDDGFGAAEFWAWKDPRTCLTLPFWQRLLPPMHYVICLRSPADVARSLERRSGMPRERGIYLWLAYVQHALAHTAGQPRCLIYYDRFIDDLPGELYRLARFIGVPERAEQPDVREAVVHFVDVKLRHHRSSPHPGAPDDRSDGWSSEALRLAGRAYAALAGEDSFDERELQRTLTSALATVDRQAVPWLKRSSVHEPEPHEVEPAVFLPRLPTRSPPMTAMPEDGPDFLIIGAQKAGTTSLFEYLIQHPGVAPPTKKEIHFFDAPDRFRQGVTWYRSFFPALSQRQLSGEPAPRCIITGEGSPYYIFHPRVPERVAGLFPHVKLLALLRNPVDRAYSQYQMWVRAGKEPLSFEAAIDAEPERLQGAEERLLAEDDYRSPVHRRYSYLARGIYVDQLVRWTQHFPREQMLFLKAEDLFTDPSRIVGEVLAFLGLPSVELDVSERYNVRPYAPLAPATRRRLLEYFEPHNRRLYEFLGRDFGWE